MQTINSVEDLLNLIDRAIEEGVKLNYETKQDITYFLYDFAKSKAKVFDMCLRTDSEGNVLPQREIKGEE